MVFAEDSASPGQGLVMEFPGLPIVAETRTGLAELAGRVEGIGVVFAEDAAAPGQRVLVERAGALESPSHHRFHARSLAEVRVSG